MYKTIFIPSFNKHLLSICVRPSGSTRLGDRAMRKTDEVVGLPDGSWGRRKTVKSAIVQLKISK